MHYVDDPGPQYVITFGGDLANGCQWGYTLITFFSQVSDILGNNAPPCLQAAVIMASLMTTRLIIRSADHMRYSWVGVSCAGAASAASAGMVMASRAIAAMMCFMLANRTANIVRD